MEQPDFNHAGHDAPPLVLPFTAIGAADLPLVGGKGANLGVLTNAGFPVPPGFCVTTSAFEQFMAATSTADLYSQLASLEAPDVERVRQIGQEIRERLRQIPIPLDVEQAVRRAWEAAGSAYAYAVRSSATAEDLPDASFAGQQDTYLNVRGVIQLLDAVRDCWISLFTDRAILYRMQNSFDHRQVRLSVVVQRMIEPEVSGIMFTADPVTGQRGIVSVDASYGLGEALVSGLVSADLYKVDKQSQHLVAREIADKHLMIRSRPQGGVEQVALQGAERTRQVLDDVQVLELAATGTRIEAHYGQPQDIEWALARGRFFILQSRPITSLYPLPQPAPKDGGLHLYFSFSHFQVMTDAMPELVISIWRTLFPFGRRKGQLETDAMVSAGGRIYVDISAALRHPLLKHALPEMLGNADTLAAQAIELISTRDSFQRSGTKLRSRDLLRWMAPLFAKAAKGLMWATPEGTAQQKAAELAQHVEEADRRISAQPTAEARLRTAIDILNNIFVGVVLEWFPYLMAGMFADRLLDRMTASFADRQHLTALTRGIEGNVTTEMDLAVGDLADILRAMPELLDHLSQSDIPASTLLATLDDVPGAAVFAVAWQQFLARYGTRAPSEIDLSRPRWHEDAGSLLQMVVGSAQQGSIGAHRAHYARLVAEGDAAARQLVMKAWRGAWGWLRGPVVWRLVRVLRHFSAMREHHKFLIIQLGALLKAAVLEVAEQLVAQKRLDRVEDIWFLTIPELLDALANPRQPLRERVHDRSMALQRFGKLRPPRVMTSAGEIPVVRHRQIDAPAGVLLGSPVSAGVVEGIARVVRDPQTEKLNPGEILVAPFTDPGWTPLFINAAGLVMEVGGLMTHGSVVAREYGVPAVVGVLDATALIQTGQRVRVHGDAGYVEIIDAEDNLNDQPAQYDTVIA